MQRRHRSTFRQVGAAAVALGALSALTATPAAPTATADPSCPAYVALGVPGSNQGAAHDDSSPYGREVAAAIARVVDEVDDVTAEAIDYPAALDPFTMFADLEDSDYTSSKHDGYMATYSRIHSWDRRCASTRFILAGYSQGAHIAGDLARTIIDEGKPVGSSRLAGGILIADPAQDPTSSTTIVLTDRGYTGDRGQVRGVLGQRTPFDEADNVVSVCVDYDPVCAMHPIWQTDGHMHYADDSPGLVGSPAEWAATRMVDGL